MGLGYLEVRLHTNEGALPIAGIRVLVKTIGRIILYELETDIEGVTPRVGLEAPDKYHSLNPNDPGPHFSVYEVEVKGSAGYDGVIIHGVQIFDTQTSILPVSMKQSAGRGIGVEEIDIMPRYGIKTQRVNMPPAPESSVPKEVVIPEYITVHMGAPNATADNMRIKFTDYIKGTVCSEIFPTWPEASIRANIYAQTSFALSRVYTMFYGKRGFMFDITSSPDFDQAFIYGRCIFENISIIADEISNVFIRRFGELEPYFAQCCNGTTATGDGLLRWGTVPLAEMGYTPFEILRYYYPNDIKLSEANAGI